MIVGDGCSWLLVVVVGVVVFVGLIFVSRYLLSSCSKSQFNPSTMFLTPSGVFVEQGCRNLFEKSLLGVVVGKKGKIHTRD